MELSGEFNILSVDTMWWSCKIFQKNELVFKKSSGCDSLNHKGRDHNG